MKLTDREKLLLKILGAAAVLILAFYFIIQPQLLQMETLSLQLVDKEIEVSQVRAEIASLTTLEQSVQELAVEIEGKTDSFYPVILQKKIIILLDDLFKSTGIETDSTAFSQISVKPVNGIQNSDVVLQNMSITFPFKGSYEQILHFISALEAMDRVIIVNSIQMARAEDGLISGGMNIDFYAFSKADIGERDDEYIHWPYENDYGKANPFYNPHETSENIITDDNITDDDI